MRPLTPEAARAILARESSEAFLALMLTDEHSLQQLVAVGMNRQNSLQFMAAE